MNLGCQTASQTSPCLPSSRIAQLLLPPSTALSSSLLLIPGACNSEQSLPCAPSFSRPQGPASLLTGAPACFLLSLCCACTSGIPPRAHLPSQAGPSFLSQRLHMLCVWPVARWGPEKQNLSSDCPIFSLSPFFLLPQNEAGTSLLSSKRASSIAGPWQKYVLLLRGRNAIVNNGEKQNRGRGGYGGLEFMNHFTSIWSYEQESPPPFERPRSWG